MAGKKKTIEPEEIPSIKSAVSSTLKNKKFDSTGLNRFKKTTNLLNNASYKPQTWVPLSEAFNDSVGLPGIPECAITLLRGLSDTGKTTALCEAATSAQRMGKLVVFIINEMKFSFEHLKKYGFRTVEEVDTETGEIIHTGDFIFADRLMLPTIESTGKFILELIQEQEKGKLPYDLFFALDSFGNLPSEMSVSLGKNDARWNSAAMNLTFASFINHKFSSSRRTTSKYNNTLLAVNKQGIKLPESPVEKPKRTSKGGSSMYFDAALVIDFGGVTTALTSKIDAVRNGKTITFAKRTKISVDKNHISNSSSTSKLIMTDYGFIHDTPSAISKYKEEHKHEWLTVLGGDDFDIVEEPEAIDEGKVSFKDVEQGED